MVVKNRMASQQWLEAGSDVRRVLRKGWVVFRHTREWEPPTDVYEKEEGLVVQVEIAGMREEDFSITLGERMLVIEGVRRDPESKRSYYQMEIRYGEFRAEVYLPWPVDPDLVEATYQAGFLRVFLPRPPAHRVAVVDQRQTEG